MHQLCVLFLFTLLISTDLLAEQKTVYATGKAVITNGITLKQAKNQALNHARSLAIEQAAGISIHSSLLMENALVVSEFIKTFSYGFLVKEEILNWQGEWIQTKKHQELGLPVVSVKIRAQVEVPKNSFFRNYALEATLNKQVFRSGELAEIDILSKDDLFILVVNYTSDNKIIPIFPFSKSSQNHIKKNTHLILPGKLKNQIEIAVHNYPGHKQDTEAFIIIGIKVSENTSDIPFYSLFQPGVEISYPEFFNKLFELPIPWIAEKTIVYNVFAD